MKKFFEQLRPNERRLAVGVLVILILVLNWVFIWPHFSDWSNLKGRMAGSQKKLALYQKGIAEKPKYEGQVKKYESAGQFVAPEDQAINFMRTVQAQAAASGLGIGAYGRETTRTNQFFTELSQGITVVATDGQLVDFLYKLGGDASMVRVRSLEMQPDGPHQHLNANITLVASYQKKPRAAASKISAAAKTKMTIAPAATHKTTVAPRTRPHFKPAKAK